jgi:Acyl-CoA dehydrogenases
MLTDEQEALREAVATFAQDKVAPVIAGHYANHTFPYEIVAAMGAMGLFGLPFPTEYGGMGGDLMALGIAIEELARVDSSVAITLEAAVCLGPCRSTGTARPSRRRPGCPGWSRVRPWPPSA